MPNKSVNKQKNNTFTKNFTLYYFKFFTRDFAKHLEKKVYTLYDIKNLFYKLLCYDK
jgi:hypothetical protein